ncbi:MAG: hypothetical protein ACRD2R_00885, partial [Terriglobales bacterium]
MKLAATFALCLALTLPAQAATQVFLTTTVSALAFKIADDYPGYGCNSYSGEHRVRLAATTRGTTTVNTSQTPSSAAPPCQFGTESSLTYNTWMTPPLSSAVTISGNIDYQAGCRESQTAMNAG